MPPKYKDVTFQFIPVRVGLSTDKIEVRRRALNLYKAWYRRIPMIFYDYKMPMTPEEGRSKLREIFVKNSQINDPKTINALIMRGEMELNESVNKQKEECHLWKYFRSVDRRAENFLTKFIEGK